MPVSIIVCPILPYWEIQMQENRKQKSNKEEKKPKRPFTESDFVTVLKAATKPLKKGQDEKESVET